MIFSWNDGRRIVASYPGTGTCETIYVTDDGTRWRRDPTVPIDYARNSSATAPSRTGVIKDGYIIPS